MCCDWSVQIHYSSIKHAVYSVHVRHVHALSSSMHANYVMSKHHAISLAFYKINKKPHPRALSYISTWEFLKTQGKCNKYTASPHASLCTSLVFLKIPAHL